jgi:hypothetical protein
MKIEFPKIRRVSPGLIANEIVSVRPMKAPVGGIFYTGYQYDYSPQDDFSPFIEENENAEKI